MAMDLTCKNCSARMPTEGRFCPNCGTSVPEPEPAPALEAEPVTVATVDDENGASPPVAFAPEQLATALEPLAEPEPSAKPEPEPQQKDLNCPSCGYPIRPGASFCERCSHKLWTPGSARAESRPRDFGVAVASGSLAVREAAMRQAAVHTPPVPAHLRAPKVATCPRCETGNWVGDASCSNCGLPLEHSSPEGVPYQVAKLGSPAGFWIRLVAFLADVAIVFGIGAAIWPILFGETFWITERTSTFDSSSTIWRTQNWHVLMWLLYSIVFLAIYGATPGKRIFRIRVYDGRHRRGIGFVSATVRVITMWLSAIILLIGFIMAGARRDKRALHDLIAGTYPTSTW